LVGLRFSAIRSEGADGSRGIFFKEFNAPTAIHTGEAPLRRASGKSTKT
jgi:hypothetical protein